MAFSPLTTSSWPPMIAAPAPLSGFGQGRQSGPPVGGRVVALHRVGVAAGGELAAAHGVQVVPIGRGGEVVTGHRDAGAVVPGLAVEDLGLADQLLGWPVRPPTTTILSPTTAAAPAARG